MHLTKLELQEMLREMGVKFSHTESYENLKKLFQEENHMRWMGKMQPKNQRAGSGYKRVIRKRAAPGTQKMMVLSKPPVNKNHVIHQPTGVSKNPRHPIHREKTKKIKSFAKPTLPGHKAAPAKEPGEIFDRGKDIFATVLRRAQKCCEFCGNAPGEGHGQTNELKPFYIQPLTLGGEVSVKNVVALCSKCHEHLTKDALPSDLKQLKRKARGKIIRTIQIQRKPRL